MSKIKPWEKIPKNADKPDGAYITRIGDSQWGVEPYEYGFIVGKIGISKGLAKLRTETAKYPSDIYGLQTVIRKLGHVLDGVVVDGLEEAVQGQYKAAKLAAAVSSQLQGVFKDAS